MTRVAAELHKCGEQFQLKVPQTDEAEFHEVAAAARVDLSIEGDRSLDLPVRVRVGRNGAS
jgi:hypothetical protein